MGGVSKASVEATLTNKLQPVHLVLAAPSLPRPLFFSQFVCLLWYLLECRHPPAGPLSLSLCDLMLLLLENHLPKDTQILVYSQPVLFLFFARGRAQIFLCRKFPELVR
jgi:hypothetical protein